jgi:hypothetical protein
MQGKKDDQEKTKMSLISMRAIAEVAAVGTFGARKYGPMNWTKGLHWSRLQDAMLRHYREFVKGNDLDSESRLLHTAHMAWNALALVTCQLLKIGEDDRWEKTSAQTLPPSHVPAKDSWSFVLSERDFLDDTELEQKPAERDRIADTEFLRNKFLR